MRHEPSALVNRLLGVVEQDIAPLTRAGVKKGNKIFGAAILLKSDLSLVLAGTNNEIENPLWHGEMHTLKLLYEQIPNTERPAPADCIFFSTHEPCTLCLSAITWAGYDNFTYLFSHEDSRDSFNIPHDLRILKEVFTLDPGGYNKSNVYWKSRSVGDLVAQCDEDDRALFAERLARIETAYAELSEIYQASKGTNEIPLN
ncbi:MAG: nucleoside deaminase [Hyphomicrobiales bacterium]